ncbi:MAG: HAMP domain-containing sensor histidine kinase [Phenylobacterium sp.]|uniref:sensor histidine kinase n=1 Tax=Phenylobacterium sp. TaxID=1871053 RepID=UPI0027325C42|nr:HAMP domain-containing sensor histidine kinase [Phenylobacterium sp.]MDP3172817.1 HAMP domain-containing sensor histidine kinase [Phenylobacterium sp.]
MADAPSPQALQKPHRRRFFWPGGLSTRLLILTALFVALGGALVLPPVLATFEEQWLLDRVRAAELASLAPEVAPERVVSEQLAAQLLEGAGVERVAVQEQGMRRLVLGGRRMTTTPYLVDLRDQAPGSWLAAPFQTLFGGEGRRVRVVAEPRFRKADFVEIVAPDTELKRDLRQFLLRLMVVTAFVSTMAGVLVYLSLNFFLVRPMQRITRSMERFRADPDDPAARIELSGRRDEVGRAEVELDLMQGDLRTALNSRARLAALGEAVAKINHDLRNMLTSAQIASERLAALKDPKVSQALPRLERALDRAVKLATDVLTYGKTQEAAPDAGPVPLLAALEMAAEEARMSDEGVRLVVEAGRAEQVSADPDQLHRILVNLLRNAREAIERQQGRESPGEVRVSMTQADDVSLVRFADNGPGVPERLRERLFQPFASSGRPDGAGLGLAIARELAQGHGGDLTLVESSPRGSVFELKLPGAPGPLRRRRARPAPEGGELPAKP